MWPTAVLVEVKAYVGEQQMRAAVGIDTPGNGYACFLVYWQHGVGRNDLPLQLIRPTNLPPNRLEWPTSSAAHSSPQRGWLVMF